MSGDWSQSSESSSFWSSSSMMMMNETAYPPNQLGPESVIIPCILAVIALFAVVGNSLVVYIVLRYRNMRHSVTNFYIMNVAVSDLVFILLCVPLTSTLYADYDWKLGNVMCKLSGFLQPVSVQATCATLTVMTVDRYYVITNPFTSRQTRTVFRAGLICCIVWIVSGIVHIPSALAFGTKFHDWNGEEVRACTIVISPSSYKYISLYVISITYVIPLTIITFCYSLILVHLWKVSRRGVALTASSNEKSGKSKGRGDGSNNNKADGASVQTATKKWKTTRIVLIVVLLFALCWLPIHAINLWMDVDPHYNKKWNHAVHYTRLASLVLAYSNSCVNPVIYALTGNSFQVHLRQMFPFRRGHGSDVTTMTIMTKSTGNYAYSGHRHGRISSHTEQVSMTTNTSV